MDKSSSEQHASRTQKLKDTCDTCSTSKVRCSKEKPVCSRCNNLGYFCSYSPARRIGRPYPLRGENTQKRATVAPPTRNPQRKTLSEGEKTKSVTQVPQTRSRQSFDTRELCNINSNSTSSTLESFDHLSSNQSSSPHCIPKVSSPYKQNDFAIDTHMFGLQESVNFSVDASCHYFDSMDTADSVSQLKTPVSLFSSDLFPGEDCTTVAMNMLNVLNGTAVAQIAQAEVASSVDPRQLDHLIDMVAHTIKHVSTILVCPCSQKPDAGLLTVAVCAAVLDIHRSICRKVRARSVPAACNAHDQPYDVDVTTLGQDVNKTSTSEARSIVTRELEELSKVAHLVAMLTRRYGGQLSQSGSKELILLLAASLRTRLKSMTNEATSWLAQI